MPTDTGQFSAADVDTPAPPAATATPSGQFSANDVDAPAAAPPQTPPTTAPPNPPSATALNLAHGAYHVIKEFFGDLDEVSRGILSTAGFPESINDIPAWSKKLATDPQTGQAPSDPRAKIGMAVMNAVGGPLRAQLNTFQKPGWQNKVAAFVPVFGPIGSKAAGEVEEGKGLEALGTALTPEVMAAGSSSGRATMAEGVKQNVQSIKDLKAGVSGRAQLVESVHAGLAKDADAAKTDLAVAKANVGNRVGQLVDAISNSDMQESSTRGAVGSIKVAPVHDAIVSAMDKFGVLSQSKTPLIDQTIDLLSQTPAKMPWESAKDLRSLVGQIVYRAKEGSKERAVVGAAYAALTDQLKGRAEELQMGDQFGAYNQLHSTMMDYLHQGILGKLMDTESGVKFFDELRKPSNGPELENLNRDLEQFGLANNFFKGLVESHKAMYRMAKASESTTAGFQGKFRALGAHPVAAGSAFMGTAAIPVPLPGKFILSLFAAAKAADIADRVQAHSEMIGMGGPVKIVGKFGNATKVTPEPGSFRTGTGIGAEEGKTPE